MVGKLQIKPVIQISNCKFKIKGLIIILLDVRLGQLVLVLGRIKSWTSVNKNELKRLKREVIQPDSVPKF